MNAVDRFWRARCDGDWALLASQLRTGVRVRLRHEGRELGREEYLGLLQVVHGDATTRVERVVQGRGLAFAVLATVARGERTLGCAGFYDLHDGLIQAIDETWMVPGGGRLLEDY